MNKQKLFKKMLSGSKNIRFTEAQSCAAAFGFRPGRINGSHHIYEHPDIPEIVNLQNIKGKAKPYQIRQLLKLIEKHNLQMGENQ